MTKINPTFSQLESKYLFEKIAQEAKKNLEVGMEKGIHDAVRGMYQAEVSLPIIQKSTGLSKKKILAIVQ